MRRPGSSVLAVRRLPYTVRGSYASLLLVHRSMEEASAVLFLSLGGWETMTVGIFSFYIAGSANEAAALGVILIVVAAVTLVLIDRIAGTRMGDVRVSPVVRHAPFVDLGNRQRIRELTRLVRLGAMC
jgi:ABC-type Fe3+ transport system permease subunit